MTRRSSGFKIGSDTEPDLTVPSGRSGMPGGFSSDRNLPPGRRDVERTAASARRATLLAVFLFVVATGLGIFGYLDISRKLHGSVDERTADIRETAARLEDRFSELSAVLAELEKKRTEEREPLEDTLLEFEENMARLQQETDDAIKRINGLVVEKAARNRVETSFKQMDADLEASRNARERIREDLTAAEEQLAARIATMEETLKNTTTLTAEKAGELNEAIQSGKDTAAAVRTEMERLRKEVLAALGDTLDRKALNRALSASEKRLQAEIRQIADQASDHDRLVKRLASRVQELESRVRFLEKAPLGRPEPGTVLEQNIN